MTGESRRITLSSPVLYDPPRFAVGGQTGQGSGDVKLYEWIREVCMRATCLVIGDAYREELTVP